VFGGDAAPPDFATEVSLRTSPFPLAPVRFDAARGRRPDIVRADKQRRRGTKTEKETVVETERKKTLFKLNRVSYFHFLIHWIFLHILYTLLY
jgi:hypothetical protein